MDKNEERSILRRLEHIESSLSHIKVILLAMLVILVIGVFGPRAVVQLIGGTVFVIGLAGCALYAGLSLLDVLVKRKMGSDEEREEQMKQTILASITSESKTDEPAD